ncbi:hypothetical protein TPHA_0C04070 [Tetrapisispora phaffii CBS 4417]|uniref:Vacuolar protein sorting-associated protein 20 n=1 Tax=Tetrapisispora phaffii (strain ATCC 24235 / CBS 4417 / NBRC 1672 / NRRL Y-8282 / UCD 70-5) TaxID=1071381 RepID=G8BQP5_TETPH|nr:hypothetical protein TPHA_0C04070 [Tetrapisispora phaffii CBS 4417]CCE62557.1 hypothetical protein TPHA_0C04070 [Tetrapisispora phaffii CBS 4417]
MGQKGSRPQITQTDKAILELKRSKDNIHKFTKRTEQLINDERQTLKVLIKENPVDYKQNTKIRFLLKRIHYQEDLVQKASDQLTNLENMVSNIEFKIIEKRFVDGLKSGNEILKKMNREFGDVNNLMDDVQNQIDYQNEIDNVLSTSIVGINNYEDEVDKELEHLEQEVNPSAKEVERLPSIVNVANLKENNNIEEKLNEMPDSKREKIAILDS